MCTIALLMYTCVISLIINLMFSFQKLHAIMQIFNRLLGWNFKSTWRRLYEQRKKETEAEAARNNGQSRLIKAIVLIGMIMEATLRTTQKTRSPLLTNRCRRAYNNIILFYSINYKVRHHCCAFKQSFYMYTYIRLFVFFYVYVYISCA